jgi:hypothetical protein
MKDIKSSDFGIPFFVDSTSPPDHKCGGCEHRIWADGKYTCKLVEQDIDLKRGTCLLWEEGPEKYTAKDIQPSRVMPETAGYIEADKVNCGTCTHYAMGICKLWAGHVKAGQCCVVWEQR